MYATTITQTGQITLSKAFRDKLGVHPGERVVLSLASDHAIVRRQPTDEEFFTTLDSFKSEKTKQKIKEYAGKSVAELRETAAYRKGYQEKYGY